MNRCRSQFAHSECVEANIQQILAQWEKWLDLEIGLNRGPVRVLRVFVLSVGVRGDLATRPRFSHLGRLGS